MRFGCGCGGQRREGEESEAVRTEGGVCVRVERLRGRGGCVS